MAKKSRLSQHDIALSAFHLLQQQENIVGRVGVKTSQFSFWIGVSKPTMSKALNWLIENNYLIRLVTSNQNGTSTYSYTTNNSRMFEQGFYTSCHNSYIVVRNRRLENTWQL